MTGKKLTDHPTDKVISEKKQSYPKYQIKNRRAILPNILPFQPQTLRVIDLQYFYFQYLAEVQIVEFSQFIIFSGLCPAKFIYEGENETYIEASVENSSSILYDKEIRNKPRTRRTKRNV